MAMSPRWPLECVAKIKGIYECGAENEGRRVSGMAWLLWFKGFIILGKKGKNSRFKKKIPREKDF